MSKYDNERKPFRVLQRDELLALADKLNEFPPRSSTLSSYTSGSDGTPTRSHRLGSWEISARAYRFAAVYESAVISRSVLALNTRPSRVME